MITPLILNPKTYISRPDLEALCGKPRKFLTGYNLPPENESRSNVTLQRENKGYWAEEREDLNWPGGSTRDSSPRHHAGLGADGDTHLPELPAVDDRSRAEASAYLL